MTHDQSFAPRRLLAALLAAGALLALGPVCAAAEARTSHHRRTGAARRCRTLRHRAQRQRCGRGARSRHHRSTHTADAKRKNAGAKSVSASPPAAATAPAPAAPATCTGTEVIPTSSNIAEVRAATMCLINRERELHGEGALSENPKLLMAAQGHSEDMVARNYFSHTTPTGEAFDTRILATGYATRNEAYMLGENIDCATLYLATPAATVQAWMNSPEHRENILNGEYRETGVGVAAAAPSSFAEGQPGATYTQDFGVIAP